MTALTFSVTVTAAPTGGTLYGGYTPTIYAAPTALGNGSGSSEANARALSTVFGGTVAAGAIVGLLPGVYSRTNSTGAATRFIPAWNSPSSGTAGNPIRFVAKYPAAIEANTANWTEMRSNAVGGSMGSPAFGADSRNYIEWIGVYASDEPGHSASADDSSVCMLHATTGCAIRYCVVRGNGAQWGINNYHGITAEGNTNVTITHNDVSNYYTGSVGAANANGCGIMLDNTGGTGLVERNYLWNCGAGLFHKRADSSGGGAYNHGNWTVRYNKVSGCQTGIRFDSTHSAGQTTWTVDVYQNLFVTCQYAMAVGNSSNDAVGKVRFQNNTVASGSGARAAPLAFPNVHPSAGQGFKYWNNISSATVHGFYKEVSGTTWDTTALDSQHNVWNANSGAFWYQDGPTFPYSTWTANGMESVAPASITSSPLFVGGGSYKLQAGSPALTLGRDLLGITGTVNATIPAGCYITGNEIIGIS